MTKDEGEFRLRPLKPRIARRTSEGAWAILFKAVLHYARTSRRRHHGSAVSYRTRLIRPHSQRCAVRATYSRNAIKGQWRAHGQYLARDSATGEAKSTAVGFDAKGESVEVASTLGEWQQAGDERLWKLIISPEFGERVDLKNLARHLVRRMESDLGTSLEWVAVSHYNTEHPHIHIALRGVDGDGKPFKLDRDYIKHGIRGIAADLCTNQLGYRTELDADSAQGGEVRQYRLTSLDRLIRNRAIETGSGEKHFEVALERHGSQDGYAIPVREAYIAQRLMTLRDMGLATPITPNSWAVNADFENVLRSMQRVRDRQKTLAVHGAAVSDDRLPVQMLDFRERRSVEGRVLVHGEEEGGRTYLMLEGTDARIHHIHYTPEIEEARSRGAMKANSFVRLRRLMVNGKPVLEIDDLGDSEALLRNRKHFRESAKNAPGTGAASVDSGWGGWLGHYESSMRQASTEIAAEREQKQRAKARVQAR